ncbi:fucolectin-5-like [Anneissia japonica]|uniref:fucolectin-5-like n=1 Tax=Anneissia japonica TaxID=1529436 RepID=UPI00142572E5|nr:fucolectin-5-like [Anneissia japonica]
MGCKLIFLFFYLGTYSATIAELVSEGRPTKQISVGWDGCPGRAVDGNTDTNYGKKSCSHTQKGVNNWWMVDLGRSYRIAYVRIYNREDCCKERLAGAQVRVGPNFNGMLTNTECGTPITDAEINAGDVIDRVCSINGQYVSISLPTDNYLTLCEVQVFTPDLLSAGRPAKQSSIGWDGVPGRAVDGNTDTNYGQKSCTHTQNEAENWWMVDLEKTSLIYGVKIYNREGCDLDSGSKRGVGFLPLNVSHLHFILQSLNMFPFFKRLT